MAIPYFIAAFSICLLMARAVVVGTLVKMAVRKAFGESSNYSAQQFIIIKTPPYYIKCAGRLNSIRFSLILQAFFMKTFVYQDFITQSS